MNAPQLHTYFIALISLLFAGSLQATTYTVNNTGNTGVGTLRQAITDANAHANSLNAGSAPDLISFSIPGNGPHTISPTTPLPNITEAIVIDGYTQGDSTSGTTADDALENTNAVGQGLNTVLTIEVAGGLGVSASNTTIRGLSIHGGGVSSRGRSAAESSTSAGRTCGLGPGREPATEPQRNRDAELMMQ